jgi:hypothetical protein
MLTRTLFVLQTEATPICTGRVDTSDVSTPQACHVMPSAVRLVLIDAVLSFTLAINYELLL